MKSIILGAFILSIFFAVAQSLNVSQHHSRFHYPEKSNSNTTVADSAGSTQYVNRQRPLKKPGTIIPVKSASIAVKVP